MANLESSHKLPPHPGIFWALALSLFLFGAQLSSTPLANSVPNLPGIFGDLAYVRNLGANRCQNFSQRQRNRKLGLCNKAPRTDFLLLPGPAG